MCAIYLYIGLFGCVSSPSKDTFENNEQISDLDIENRFFSIVVQPDFSLLGGIPNAHWLEEEESLALTYLHNGWQRIHSNGDLNFSADDGLQEKLTALTFDVPFQLVSPIVRTTTSGQRRYFAKALTNESDTERALYAFEENDDDSFSFLNSGEPVYTGTEEGKMIEVPDIIKTPLEDQWRLFYVAKDASSPNTRTAISDDEGLSWSFEHDNPFGDLETAGQASGRNVDPAPYRLQDDSYMAITMRGTKLYFWNSVDGLSFIEAPDNELVPSSFSSLLSDPIGLFDPTLAQLDDGSLHLFVTVQNNDTSIIANARIYIESE